MACDDPGAAIGTHLVLPLLRERLDRKALEAFANRSCDKDPAMQVGLLVSGLDGTCSTSTVLSVLCPV